MDSIKFSDFKTWVQESITDIIKSEMSTQLTEIKDGIQHMKEISNELQKQECQIEFLKNRCDVYEENIGSLKSIIAKQQQSLNSIDSSEQDKNLIVSGSFLYSLFHHLLGEKA